MDNNKDLLKGLHDVVILSTIINTRIFFSQHSCFYLNTKYHNRGFMYWCYFPLFHKCNTWGEHVTSKYKHKQNGWKSRVSLQRHFSPKIESNGYTMISSLSEIHIYIQIPIRKPNQETMLKRTLICHIKITRGAIVNRINMTY